MWNFFNNLFCANSDSTGNSSGNLVLANCASGLRRGINFNKSYINEILLNCLVNEVIEPEFEIPRQQEVQPKKIASTSANSVRIEARHRAAVDTQETRQQDS
ncbi:hypothetical protein TKK_0000233 [Trichogramma kaykai]